MQCHLGPWLAAIAMVTGCVGDEDTPPEPKEGEVTSTLTSCSTGYTKVSEACGAQGIACSGGTSDQSIHGAHDPYAALDSQKNCIAKTACQTALDLAVEAARDCKFAGEAASSTTAARNKSLAGAGAAGDSFEYDLLNHRNNEATRASDASTAAAGRLDEAADLFAACAAACCPAAPSGTYARAMGASLLKITWNDNSSNEISFSIERSDNGGAWFGIAEPDANSESETDGFYSGATAFRYRVRANGSSCSSPWSALAIVPKAPANLGGTYQGGTTFMLTWSDKSNNETSFMVQKKAGSAPWNDLQGVAPNTTTTNVQLSNGMNRFRVRATTSTGSSWYTNEVSYTL